MDDCKPILNTGQRGVTIASTKISDVRGEEGKLIYRGFLVQDLAESASFEEFIIDYLSQLGNAPLDPHVWPQDWHLCDVIYDLAIPLQSLSAGMWMALGPRFAADHFKHKVNSSASYRIEVDSEISSRVSEIYAADYRMIERLSGK